MKFGKLAGLVLALGVVCGPVAHAQVSVYGMYQASRLSGMPCQDPQNLCSGTGSNSEGLSLSGGNSSHVNVTGGWGGITYDFRNVGPVRLGIDLRAGEGHSNKSGTSYAGGADATSTQNVLAGVKGTFHTPISALHPYVQVSAGWARSNAAEPFGTTNSSTFVPYAPRRYDNFVMYEGFAGLDIRTFPWLDVRLPEVGIGNMNLVGGAGTATTSSIGVKSISLGIVLHLPSF